MPFANEHAARQEPPGVFERASFRRKVIAPGVSFILGRRKGSEETSTQSVRFNAKKFTPAQARKWLESHNMKVVGFEKATGEEKEKEVVKEDANDEECFRFDHASLSKFRLDSQGFMHVGATFSTVGVYKYRAADGTIRREFRPPEEVQSDRFINSLKGCVITNEHPPGARPVTIKNVKQFQVGHAGTNVKCNGLKVDGDITLTDINTIQDVRIGAKRGISIGYRCKTRYDPGIWEGPNGPIPYDYVQYGHLANHGAVCSSPRGGLGNDGTALHLDSLEAEQITEDEENKMTTVRLNIDDMGVDLPMEAAPIVKTALDRRDSAVAESVDKLKEYGEKIGKLEGELETITKERDTLKTDSEDKPNISALVKQRLELVEQASGLIDEKALDAIDSDSEDYDSQVIDACLKEAGVDLEEAAKLHTDSEVLAVYKRARFDGLVALKGDAAHQEMSSAVVVTPLTRRDSKEPEYRKDVRNRLKIAQQKRDGTYVEKSA